MVRKTHTPRTQCTTPTLLDFGFRSVKLRATALSTAESVGSNDMPVSGGHKHWRKMARGVSSNPDQRGENVRWIRENEAQFIELMYQEYLNGQLQTTSFSTAVMTQICHKLNALVRDNSVYSLEHCKTKYKRIKRAWRILFDLRYNRGSGLTWDHDRNTVIGDRTVLEPIYAEHTDNKGIIKHGLPHFDLCTEMFEKIVATGSHARSSMQPPIDSEDDNLASNESDVPLGSQSAPHFVPGESSQCVGTSSRSSGRKRSSSSISVGDRDAALARAMENFDAFITEKRVAMENFDAFITEKRSKTGQAAKDELQMCIAEVEAMDDIPERLLIKAANAFKGYATRQVFLSLTPRLRRSWVLALDD